MLAYYSRIIQSMLLGTYYYAGIVYQGLSLTTALLVATIKDC